MVDYSCVLQAKNHRVSVCRRPLEKRLNSLEALPRGYAPCRPVRSRHVQRNKYGRGDGRVKPVDSLNPSLTRDLCEADTWPHDRTSGQ